MNVRKDKQPDPQREQQGQARQDQRGKSQDQSRKPSQHSPSGMPSNHPEDDMSNRQSPRPRADDDREIERDFSDQQGGSTQPGGSRSGPDQDQRFGPGSSPQGRDNDASGNAPSREDMRRSKGDRR
jgi:hypothetical protein